MSCRLASPPSQRPSGSATERRFVGGRPDSTAWASRNRDSERRTDEDDVAVNVIVDLEAKSRSAACVAAATGARIPPIELLAAPFRSALLPQ